MKALVLLAMLSVSDHPLNRDALAKLLQLRLTERQESLDPARSAVAASTLPVDLLGTLIDDAQLLCAALVRDEGATRTLYMGSTVQRGTVVRIARDEVVIERDGALESLRSHAVRGPPPSAAPAGSATAAVTRLPNGQVHVSLQDLSAWMAVRVIPTANGLKIMGVKEGSPYAQLGVRNGDVLRSVNGQPVDFSVLQKLKPGVQLTVEIDRDGQPFSLSGSID